MVLSAPHFVGYCSKINWFVDLGSVGSLSSLSVSRLEDGEFPCPLSTMLTSSLNIRVHNDITLEFQYFDAAVIVNCVGVTTSAESRHLRCVDDWPRRGPRRHEGTTILFKYLFQSHLSSLSLYLEFLEVHVAQEFAGELIGESHVCRFRPRRFLLREIQLRANSLFSLLITRKCHFYGFLLLGF